MSDGLTLNLAGKHPRDSLFLIDKLGLYHAIFTDPGCSDMPKPDIRHWGSVYECLDHLSNTRTPGSIYDLLVRSEEAGYLALVLAAVAPWGQPIVSSSSGKPSANRAPLATQAVRGGIRASNKICELVTDACHNRDEITELKRAVCDKEAYINERDRLGMAIRKWDARCSWRLQILFAIFAELLLPGGDAGKPSPTCAEETCINEESRP